MASVGVIRVCDSVKPGDVCMPDCVIQNCDGCYRPVHTTRNLVQEGTPQVIICRECAVITGMYPG